jgi:hypothetical protein
MAKPKTIKKSISFFMVSIIRLHTLFDHSVHQIYDFLFVQKQDSKLNQINAIVKCRIMLLFEERRAISEERDGLPNAHSLIQQKNISCP